MAPWCRMVSPYHSTMLTFSGILPCSFENRSSMAAAIFLPSSQASRVGSRLGSKL